MSKIMNYLQVLSLAVKSRAAIENTQHTKSQVDPHTVCFVQLLFINDW